MGSRVVISVGGTGGHVYPALSLANRLINKGVDVLFIGGKLDENKFFDKSTFSYRSVNCGSFTNRNPLKIMANMWYILQGVCQSRKFIKEYNPDLVVGFGSFYTFPTLIAAQLLGIPVILHEANSIPGKVNRFFSPYVEITGVHFPETMGMLKGKTAEVGMLLREGYKKGSKTRQEASAHFGLNPNITTLLIFGGSQGAKSINQVASEALIHHFKGQIQVIHITGDANASRILKYKYHEKGLTACVKDYENAMDLAWQAADLMISRSGAGTIAEELEFEVPGILIPYPNSADQHQDKNAEFMASTVGGAIKCTEQGLTSKSLADKIELMLNNNLENLRQDMRIYKDRRRQTDLYDLVFNYLE